VSAPSKEARFVAPWTPPEQMWGGLARAMMMWLDMHPKTPRALFRHLECTGQEIPQWLRDEHELQALDHVPSKGTRCVLIYRAMLWDGRSLHLTPSGHTADCEFHCEQYPHECTCGATPPSPQGRTGMSELLKPVSQILCKTIIGMGSIGALYLNVVVGWATASPQPALVSDQAATRLAPTGFDQAQGRGR
jgi:hypothetical protein